MEHPTDSNNLKKRKLLKVLLCLNYFFFKSLFSHDNDLHYNTAKNISQTLLDNAHIESVAHI